MSSKNQKCVLVMNRREAVKSISLMAAAAAAPKIAFSDAPEKFAEVGAKSRLKVGLIGCSGRGMGAVDNMMEAAGGAVKIVAIADLFADRLEVARKFFEKRARQYPERYKDAIDIPPERAFFGWDAYKKLIAEDVDIVIHATPPVFRPLHIRAAVEAGKHMFVEKPACVDPVQARQLMEIADMADKKSLTIIPGIQRRFSPAYQESIKRMQDGQIGEIVGAQAYWLNPRFFIQNKGELYVPEMDPEEMEYQIRNWFVFAWTSGDCYVEQHVHNLDVIRWGLGRDPVEVNGVGGRRWDIEFPKMGDRFSHFGVDYDFGGGVRCASYSRREQKSKDYVMERFIGTKGVLELDLGSATNRIIGQKPWEYKGSRPEPIVQEHRFLLDCLLNNKPVNMLRDMIDSTLIAIAGRESCYCGRNFKYAWLKNRSKLSLEPKEWKFGKKPIEGVRLPGIYKLV